MSDLLYFFSEEDLSPAPRDNEDGGESFVAELGRQAAFVAAASVIAAASLAGQVANQHQDELALAPPEEQDWSAPHVVRPPAIAPAFVVPDQLGRPTPSNPASSGQRVDVLYLWMGEDFPGYTVPLDTDDVWVQPASQTARVHAPLFSALDELGRAALDDDPGESPLVVVPRDVTAILFMADDSRGDAVQIADQDFSPTHAVLRAPRIPDPYVDEQWVPFIAQLDETGWDPTRVIVTKPQLVDPYQDEQFVPFVAPPLDEEPPALFAVKQPVVLPLDLVDGDALPGIRVEDDPWTAPVLGVQAPVQPAFSAEDELGGIRVDEDFWDPAVIVLRPTALPPVETGDELVGAITLEDGEWEPPVVVIRPPIIPSQASHDASGELLPARAVPLAWIIEPDDREVWVIEAGR